LAVQVPGVAGHRPGQKDDDHADDAQGPLDPVAALRVLGLAGLSLLVDLEAQSLEALSIGKSPRIDGPGALLPLCKRASFVGEGTTATPVRRA
jgi:hypothetical protein